MKPCIFILVLLALLPPAPETAFGQQGTYGIQVAAYTELKAAENEVKKLKRLGHNAFYQAESVVGKGTWYRVYIDKFNSRKDAGREARVLKDLGLIKDYAVRDLPEGATAEKPSKGISGPKGLFYLHIGSFRGELNALNSVQRMKNHGYNAFYLKERVSGKDWFRVYVGRFDGRGDAAQEGAAMKKASIINDFRVTELSESRVLAGAAGGAGP